MKNLYQILGVASNATSEEIKSKYRALARQYHPDVAQDKIIGEVRFKEINEAYSVLSDLQKRQAYDQRIRPHSNPTSMDDLYQSIFGNQQAPKPRRRYIARQDIEIILPLTAQEMHYGCVHILQVKIRANRLRTKAYRVQIPPNTQEGDRIRLKGQGINKGDLFFKIQQKT